MAKMPLIPLGERNPNIQAVERALKARNREQSRKEEQARKEEHICREAQSHKEEPASTPSFRKRKSSTAEEDRWDANQIRGKIRNLLNNSDMTVAKMQEVIHTTSNSYYRFMNQSGPTKGTQSDVYMNANVYFTKREIAGLKMPRKKKAKTEASESKDKGDESEGGRRKTKADEAKELDVTAVKLDGEEKDSVPIYLTYDDVRSLINAHLRDTSATQTSFCRVVNEMYTYQPPQGTGPGALKTFLSSTGVRVGASSPILYGSYVYFEKLRVKQGKPKSKKRQEMENIWAPRGLDTEHDMKHSITMKGDKAIFTDKYGHVEIHERGWPAPEGWKTWKPSKMGR